MDSVNLTKQNRLFWLGRYAERVCFSIPYFIDLFDKVLSEEDIKVAEICEKLGIPCEFSDAEEFCRRYTFDENCFYSIRSSAENMLGNGMVLRETISSDTLAYLQMARDHMIKAEKSQAVAIELQSVVDNIMAFRGSFDDYITNEAVRSIIKAGRSIERLSMMLRLSWHLQTLEAELAKLQSRVKRAGLPLNELSADILHRAEKDLAAADKKQLLWAVENLIIV